MSLVPAGPVALLVARLGDVLFGPGADVLVVLVFAVTSLGSVVRLRLLDANRWNRRLP